MKKAWRALSILALVVPFVSAYRATAQPCAWNLAWHGSEQQMVKGELTKVDPDKLTFTIKTENGEEVQFKYTTDTKVEGSQNGVQGLSSDTGTKVSVQYEENSGNKVATRIEIQKKDE